MSKFNSLRLPYHRVHLYGHWEAEFNPKLAKAHSIITKLRLYELTKEGLEPGKEVPSHITADANSALEEFRAAAVQNDVDLLGEIAEAARETKDLWENGVGNDLRRQIIVAYSQFYFENNPSPGPFVWVEATARPRGVSLAPSGGWQLAAPVEPTKDQLRARLSASGLKFTKRAYNAYLKELGLDDLKSAPVGRPRGKRK
jgi:flagellin-specific chaperone FliS